MITKERLIAGLKLGLIGAGLAGSIAWLIGADGTGILIAVLGVFASAMLVMLVPALWAKVASMAIVGGVFGLVVGGWRGLLGGLLGGACFPLALRYVPGRWGNAVGLFLLIAVPSAFILGTWDGALKAALAGLIFTAIYEAVTWASRSFRARKQ